MADLTPLQRLDQAIHQLDKRTPPPLELIAAMVSALSEAMAEHGRLALLAGKLLEQLGDGGVPDGGEMQELLVEAGVIAPVEVTESCGENCNCAEWDFPTTCYRKTRLGDYCAARAAGEG